MRYVAFDSRHLMSTLTSVQVLLVLLQAIFPITTEWVLNPGDDFSNFSSCYFFPPILYVIIGYKVRVPGLQC